MLGAGPFRHVRAHLADHLQRREAVDAVDPGQVHPRHPIQVCSNVEAGCVALAALFAIGSRRLAIAAVLEPLQLGFNLPVALGNLLVIEPVQFQGLGQLEDVLLPPVPLQRLGNRGFVCFHARTTKLRQLSGVPFTVHDGLYNVHPGPAGDVADDVLELHVHLGQRLLHMLDMMGRVLHQHGPLSQVAAQTPDLRVGPKGSRQQSIGVQLLQPLAVQHVGLAAGHVLDAPRVYQHHLEPTLFEHPEQRYPVHAGGLHDHGLHAALRQPVRQAIQIRRKAGELAHRRLRAVRRHRHEMAGGAHVDSRRVQVQLGQLRRQTLPLPCGLSLRFRAPLACSHHIPSSIAA